jgi:FkbM family methyltransferase
MLPFRARFAAQRFFSRHYRLRLGQVLEHPFQFYAAMILKLFPGLSKSPFDLHLKDGKIIRVREFWTLFLFDEIFMENCYGPSAVMECGPFDTLVDIGANIGLFTMRGKQLWPEAHIVALEPHPDNFRSLQEHIQINRLREVEPMQVGIAEKCGCFDLHLSPRNIAGHSMYKEIPGSDVISIRTCTLEDVLSKVTGESGSILVKIDCEGCEFPLLSALTEETAGRISCIVFEPERSLYDLDTLILKLSSLGFTISHSSGLVVAAKNKNVSFSSPLVRFEGQRISGALRDIERNSGDVS